MFTVSPGTLLVFHTHTQTHTQSAQCLRVWDDRDLQPGPPLPSGVRIEEMLSIKGICVSVCGSVTLSLWGHFAGPQRMSVYFDFQDLV